MILRRVVQAEGGILGSCARVVVVVRVRARVGS